jgi:hypothetical protein
MESNEYTFYTKVVALNEIYNFVVLSFSFEDVKMLKKRILNFSASRKWKTTFETSPSLKIEWFQELEGQSYLVLEFEVEIRTLARVGGCKLDLTLYKKNYYNQHLYFFMTKLKGHVN